MLNIKALTLFGSFAAAVLMAPTAMAQDISGSMDDNKDTIGNGQPSGTLPAPKSDNDPQPAVASPVTPDTGLVKQAGVGGQTGYGRAGVLELGGFAGFTRASQLTQVSFNPTLGWYFMDNLELSGIIGINYSNVEGNGSTFFTALAEPSFHIPFNRQLFGFAGVGAGIAYAEEQGVGFALQPRIGLNALVGRSGVLTPAMFVGYNTFEVDSTDTSSPDMQGTALLGVGLSYGLNVGYTVMW